MPVDKEPIPQEISFHYIKSNYYRVFYADGAWGGITPRGLIQINFYSERQPIPKQTTHSVLENQRLGEEIRDKRVSRDGPVREIEAGAVMDLIAAKSLLEWLKERVDTLEASFAEEAET